MKFTHHRETCFEHAHIQLACDMLNLLGCNALDETIHKLAPGPKTVLRGSTALSKAGLGTLKCMRVKIGHTWQRGASQCLHRPGELFYIAIDFSEPTVLIDFEQYVIRPTLGQKRVFGE